MYFFQKPIFNCYIFLYLHAKYSNVYKFDVFDLHILGCYVLVNAPTLPNQIFHHLIHQ